MKIIIPRSVLALSQLADTNAMTRYKGTLSVMISADGSTHRCEATNGKFLGIINGVAEGNGKILINAKEFARIKNALDKKDDKITIDADNGQFIATGTCKDGLFKSGISGEYAVPNSDGNRFPNSDTVLIKKKPVVSCLVNPLMLIKLLNAAAAVDGRKEPVITINFYEIGDPLSVNSNNSDSTQFFHGMFCQAIKP